MRSTTIGLLTLSLAVALPACTPVGIARQPTLPASHANAAATGTAGTWQETYGGQVDLQGQKLMLVMQLSGSRGDRVEGMVRIDELRLTARGEGTRQAGNGALDLRLTYPGRCPGTMTIRARPGEGGDTLLGTLRAADCTGSE